MLEFAGGTILGIVVAIFVFIVILAEGMKR